MTYVATVIVLVAIAGSDDPWADQVIAAHPAMNATGTYNDPHAVLGPPSTMIHDPAIGAARAVTLISPAYHLAAPGGGRVVLTVSRGQFVKVRFDEPVVDHPRNPFGIDLIVFGNSFFPGSDFARPDTDFASFYLFGDVFEEPIVVAVSPTGIGDPATAPGEWYVYARGPFADGMFPTNAFLLNRASGLPESPADFTIPADPALTADDFAGISAADAVDLYLCSGGGTGFDLAESGFPWIQFVYLTGIGGEVDALADVFPILGDFDRDGDIDLLDLAGFQKCFGFSYVEFGRCDCRPADFDGDGSVSNEDYLSLRLHLAGPSGD
jgi:hypothetical protein